MLITINTENSNGTPEQITTENIETVLKDKLVKYSEEKTLKLVFAPDSPEEITQSVEKFTKAITPYANFTEITIAIESNSDDAALLKAKQDLQQSLASIAARNRLLQLLKLEVKADEDPWAILMTQLVSPYNELVGQPEQVKYLSVEAIKTQYASRGIVFDDALVETISKELPALGEQGFANFLAVCFKHAKGNPPLFAEQLTCLSTAGGLTPIQLLELCLAQQKLHRTSFPFKKISFINDNRNVSEISEIKGKDLEKIILFLKENQHIDLFKLPFSCTRQEEIDSFIVQLKEAEITAHITDDFYGNRQDKLKINQCIIENKHALHSGLLESQKNTNTNSVAQATGKNYPPSWNKPRADVDPAKLQTQQARSLSQGIETSSTVENMTATTTQRMQQITNQQQRQQQLHNQSQALVVGEPLTNLIDATNYQEKIGVLIRRGEGDKRSNTEFREAKKVLVDNLWKQLTGDKTTIFSHIANDETIQAIVYYQHTFQDGLMLDNLPEGFYIQQQDDAKILCYKKITNQNREASSLTAPLFKPISNTQKFFRSEKFFQNSAGEELSNRDEINRKLDIFIGGSNTADLLLADLFYLVNKLDSVIAKSIEDNYSRILQGFTPNNFAALSFILLEQGPAGLERFLSKLQQLEARGLLDSFKTAFIDTSVNLLGLASDKTYQAIDDLCTLNPNEIAWWIQLTTDKSDDQNKLASPFVETVEAFKYFCKEVYQLAATTNGNSANTVDTRIELPNPCKITGVRNVHVALDRLLIILKNAADVKEQLYNLEGVSLHQEAAYHAIMRDCFNFVCGEMELTNDKPTTEQPFSYRVDFAQLKEDTAHTAEIFKRNFFRYLGTQRYLYPFEIYRKIYAEVTASALSEFSKQKLLAALALSTTEQRSLAYDPMPMIAAAVTVLKGLTEVQQNTVLETLTHLCETLQKKHAAKPEVLETQAIIQLLALSQNLAWLADNSAKPQLTDFIIQKGLSGIKALAMLGQRKDLLPLIQLKDFLTFSGELSKNLTFLIPALAAVNLNFADPSLVNNALQNKSPALLEKLSKVLLQINIADSKALPSLEFLQELPDSCTESDILAKIKQRFAGVTFTQPAYAAINQDCTKELIEFISTYKSELNIIGFEEEQVIKDLNDNKVQIQAVLDKLEISLNKKSSLLSGAAEAVVSGLIQKFCALQQKNLQKLISEMQLPANVADGLRERVLTFASATDNLSEINQFLANCKLMNGLLAKITGYSAAQRTELINAICAKWPEQNPFNFITTVTSLLDDKTISKEQCSKLINGVIQGDDHDNAFVQALTEIAAITKESAPALFDQVLTLVALVTNRIEKNKLCTAIAVLAKQDSTQQTHHTANYTRLLEIVATKETNATDRTATLNALTELVSNDKELEKLAAITTILAAIFPAEQNQPPSITITRLFALLKQYNSNDLAAFAELYQRKPYPDVEAAVTIFETGGTPDKLGSAENYNYANKNRKLLEQLKVDDVEDKKRIAAIKDISHESPLAEKQQKELLDALKRLRSVGNDLALYSPTEIANNIKALKARLAAAKDKAQPNKEELSNLRARLLACLAESYYQTTNKFPNNTQMLSVFLAIETGGNVISGINTGEGKSIVDNLQAAMLWCEGHTVDVVTSDRVLAERDEGEAHKFYDFIGAKSQFISDDSPINAYKTGGIHYSDPATLYLYLERCRMEGFDHRAAANSPTSLILGEADHVALDDTSQYILSNGVARTANADKNPDERLYPLVNRFVDLLDGVITDEQQIQEFKTEYFSNRQPPYTVIEEVNALRNFLSNDPNTNNEQKMRLAEANFHLQLNTWIVAAKAARCLVAGKDYAVTTKVKKNADNEETNYSDTVILERGLPNNEAMWSNGVHQLLHARLNNPPNNEPQPQLPFICKPERKPVAIGNNHSFLSSYKKKGGRILGSTGTPGSKMELVELQQRYDFHIYKIPPHKVSRRKILPPIYTKNIQQRNKELRHLIQAAGDQPVLILCNNIKEVEELKTVLSRMFNSDRIQTLTAANIANKESILQKAGESNSITISTLARRGTDIKTKHPKGLLVIDIDHLATKRNHHQGNGRPGRNGEPGEAASVYLASEETVESNRRDNDINSQRQREQNNRFIKVLAIVNEQLAAYEPTVQDTNKRKQFIKIKHALINDLQGLWQDFNTTIPDGLQHDKNNPIFPEQKLNHVTKHFIEQAESLCQSSFNQLAALAEPENVKFSLAEKLQQSAAKLTNYSVQGAGTCEENNLYVRAFKCSLTAEKSARLPRYLLNLTHSELHPVGLKNVLAFREQKPQLIQKAASDIVCEDINNYLTHSWLGSDRKKAAKALKEVIKNPRNEVSEVSQTSSEPLSKTHSNLSIQAQIVEINNSLLGSLKSDINKKYFFKRAGSSRYRDMLTTAKNKLFAMCPPSHYQAIIQQELTHLQAYLQAESQRDFYKNKTALQDLIKSVIPNEISAVNDPAALMSALGQALYKFDQIYDHPAYDDKECALQDIRSNLRHLWDYAKVVMPQETLNYQVYCSVRNLVYVMPPTPEKSNFIASKLFKTKDPYTIPKDSLFKKLIDDASLQPKQKFQLHTLCSNIRNHLAEKYAAYDIGFELKDEKLIVNYNLMNKDSFAAEPQTLAVELNWHKQTCLVEYQSGKQQINQSNMQPA